MEVIDEFIRLMLLATFWQKQVFLCRDVPGSLTFKNILPGLTPIRKV